MQQKFNLLSFLLMDIVAMIRESAKGITHLNEMVSAICGKFNLSEEVAREYILVCAFADSLKL